jgi:hypothetical protein
MRVTSLVFSLVFLACISASALAQGPRRDYRFEPLPLAIGIIQARDVPTINLVAGGLTGGVVGFFAFGIAGAFVASALSDDQGDGYEALGGFAIGALVGEAVFLPLGVHLANHRQGDYGVSLLVSAGIAALGLGLTGAMEDMGIVFLPTVPVAQLITSISIERRTAD